MVIGMERGKFTANYVLTVCYLVKFDLIPYYPNPSFLEPENVVIDEVLLSHHYMKNR